MLVEFFGGLVIFSLIFSHQIQATQSSDIIHDSKESFDYLLKVAEQMKQETDWSQEVLNNFLTINNLPLLLRIYFSNSDVKNLKDDLVQSVSDHIQMPSADSGHLRVLREMGNMQVHLKLLKTWEDYLKMESTIDLFLETDITKGPLMSTFSPKKENVKLFWHEWIAFFEKLIDALEFDKISIILEKFLKLKNIDPEFLKLFHTHDKVVKTLWKKSKGDPEKEAQIIRFYTILQIRELWSPIVIDDEKLCDLIENPNRQKISFFKLRMAENLVTNLQLSDKSGTNDESKSLPELFGLDDKSLADGVRNFKPDFLEKNSVLIVLSALNTVEDMVKKNIENVAEASQHQKSQSVAQVERKFDFRFRFIKKYFEKINDLVVSSGGLEQIKGDKNESLNEDGTGDEIMGDGEGASRADESKLEIYQRYGDPMYFFFQNVGDYNVKHHFVCWRKYSEKYDGYDYEIFIDALLILDDIAFSNSLLNCHENPSNITNLWRSKDIRRLYSRPSNNKGDKPSFINNIAKFEKEERREEKRDHLKWILLREILSIPNVDKMIETDLKTILEKGHHQILKYIENIFSSSDHNKFFREYRKKWTEILLSQLDNHIRCLSNSKPGKNNLKNLITSLFKHLFEDEDVKRRLINFYHQIVKLVNDEKQRASSCDQRKDYNGTINDLICNRESIFDLLPLENEEGGKTDDQSYIESKILEWLGMLEFKKCESPISIFDLVKVFIKQDYQIENYLDIFLYLFSFPVENIHDAERIQNFTKNPNSRFYHTQLKGDFHSISSYIKLNQKDFSIQNYEKFKTSNLEKKGGNDNLKDFLNWIITNVCRCKDDRLSPKVARQSNDDQRAITGSASSGKR